MVYTNSYFSCFFKKNEHFDNKTKSIDNLQIINALTGVGMTGFEPATSRPPDVYSNRTELHPELFGCKSTCLFWILQMFCHLFLAAHGFAIEVQHVEYFFFSGRLIDSDIANFAHQREVDDACAVLLVVSHKFV